MILALALADLKAGGWFGKVVKGKRHRRHQQCRSRHRRRRPPAGDATNVVTDYVHVRGESRSHDAKFFKEITKAYKAAFEKAARRVKNSEGNRAASSSRPARLYPFRMKDSLPVVKRAAAAVSADRPGAAIRGAKGGLDANWMVRHGIPTVTFGAGQNEPHTIDNGSISTNTTAHARSPCSLRRCGNCQFLFAHDLFGKPLHTFPDHALIHPASFALPIGIAKAALQNFTGPRFGQRFTAGSPPIGAPCIHRYACGIRPRCRRP